MAVSDRAATVGGYAQELLNNQDVQATARQAVDATKAAYQRARGQDAHEAVQDRKLRRRVTAAVAAAGEFLGAVSKAEPKPKPRWPRRIMLLAIIGVGAWLVSNEAVRARLQGLLGRSGSEDQTEPSPVREPDAPGVVDQPYAA
jgi:hypothetical protein